MTTDDKLADALGALEALGTMLQGLQDVASAASALSHQQQEQAHDAQELEQRLRTMAERLAEPTPEPTALQRQLRAALQRAQASGGLQPTLELHHGQGARPAANVAELRRQAQLAAQAGLDQQPSGPPDLGEQVLRVAQLSEAQGLQPEQVLAGVLVGAARYAHARQLPSARDWPELLGMALQVAGELEP